MQLDDYELLFEQQKITLKQLKEEFEKIRWSYAYDWTTVFRIEKITNKSIYFLKQEYKI